MRFLKPILITTLLAAAALAQTADTILINGKIITVDPDNSVVQALSIRDGHIVAVGSNDDAEATAGPNTEVIDLNGRTVIPGLIDSHIHAIRAALSFSTEVNWIGTKSLEQALDRIREGASSKPDGAWLIVAGGWDVNQFAERRLPTQAELRDAAPDNPVYVQLGYEWAMLTPKAYEVLGIESEADLPEGAHFEMANGQRTGAITGNIIDLFDLLPKPNYQQQLEGTVAFFRELNRLGLTGVIDPGGNNLTPELYQAVQKVWRDGDLSVRIAFTLNPQDPGDEFADFLDYTKLLPAKFGDDYLRFLGIGERVTFAMNNNNHPDAETIERYQQIAQWAADRGMMLTMHWDENSSIDYLLNIFEAVNRQTPIRSLRWSVAHLNNGTEPTFRRMQALGVGWTMQDAMYFGGDAQLKRDPEAARRMPAINTALRTGLHIGAGTDAHRVASYNPFTALRWMIDGRTVSGAKTRDAAELVSREDALRLYTLGSAWFAFADDYRGSLEPGKYADLAVLSEDYMTVPVEEISDLESVLTMVGGDVVYTAAEFAE